MAKSSMKGVEKAAIFLISLGPEFSANVIKQLPDSDIQKLTLEIANVSKVKPEVKKEVYREFKEINQAREYILDGGFEYARQILNKALGTKRAVEILESIREASRNLRPMAIARRTDPQQLLSAIIHEHPQTIALILCHLEPDKAATIISSLPKQLQTDVARRIATMNKTSPTMIQEVEKTLEKQLENIISTEYEAIGGVQAVVDILTQVDRGTEKNILSDLENYDPQLAEKIRENMFVFEDIVNLDNVAIQRIIREVDMKDLALAIKGSSDELARLIFQNMSKSAGENLQEEIEFLGPVRLSEIEKAQQRIVSVIRRLDEAEEIIIDRGGKDEIIA